MACALQSSIRIVWQHTACSTLWGELHEPFSSDQSKVVHAQLSNYRTGPYIHDVFQVTSYYLANSTIALNVLPHILNRRQHKEVNKNLDRDKVSAQKNTQAIKLR